MRAGHLQIEGISRRFGGHQALKHVAFDIRAGEFVTLLGPSGSGKTTTLKIIAGFIQPDAGTVILDSTDITCLPPHQRDIGMVFQNYALFPHMTVAENVAFPLEMRRAGREETARRVARVLDMVRLPGLSSRRPRELSGGQQQRVALARALVFHPRLLLMDEPLGALDRKLREAMQFEIIQISRALGITVVYVTHDQEEALAMSHRIAVYHDGEVEQIGSPEEVYQRPRSRFVATFVGESTTLLGVLERRDGEMRLVGESQTIRVSCRQCEGRGLVPGDRAALIVRPESIGIETATPAAAVDSTSIARVRGQLQSSVYLGTSRKYLIALPGGPTALARISTDDGRTEAIADGSEVQLFWQVESGIVLPDQDHALGQSTVRTVTSGQRADAREPNQTDVLLASLSETPIPRKINH